MSFRRFKETFLELYLKMASDKIAELRIQFLYSATVVRPYLEQDVDLLLRFNNGLNQLQMDSSQSVCLVSNRIDEELRKNRS